MQITNTRAAYGWAAILLHWTAAIAVAVLYFGGDDAGEAATRELRAPLLQQHISLGMVLLALLAVRVAWSLGQPKPEKLAHGRWVGVAAKAVQYGFLAMIAVEIVTGPLAVWSTGRAIEVYDWVSVPSPFSSRQQDIHEAAEIVHGWAAKLFWPLVVLHILGAAKSIVIDRDRTLQRMLWVRRVAK